MKPTRPADSRMTPGDPPAAAPEEIAELARKRWQEAGSPPGRDIEFWLAAELELTRGRESAGRADRKHRERSLEGESTPLPPAGQPPPPPPTAEESKPARSRGRVTIDKPPSGVRGHSDSGRSQ